MCVVGKLRREKEKVPLSQRLIIIISEPRGLRADRDSCAWPTRTHARAGREEGGRRQTAHLRLLTLASPRQRRRLATLVRNPIRARGSGEHRPLMDACAADGQPLNHSYYKSISRPATTDYTALHCRSSSARVYHTGVILFTTCWER